MRCSITGCDQLAEANIYYVVGSEQLPDVVMKQVPRCHNLCGAHASQLWTKLTGTPASQTVIIDSVKSESEIEEVLAEAKRLFE